MRTIVGAQSLIGRKAPRHVIDLFGIDESVARQRYPRAFQHLLDTVRPLRAQQKRAAYAQNWWVFAEPRPALRDALGGLCWYVATVETARHRWFSFVSAATAPEQTLVAIAIDKAELFAVLSSRVHQTFAAAAGSRMGVGNDLRYTIARCFDPFPFPDPDETTKQLIRDLGEQLDAHRKRQQELHPDLTITGMYNVLEKLRANEPLTEKGKVIHEKGLVSILKQIHDDLDAAVFDAYGWPRDLSDEEVLERLVALNHERTEEENRGLIRWLRPEFQNPSGVQAVTQQKITLVAEPAKPKAPAAKPEWPATFPDQLLALRSVMYSSVEPWTLKTLAREFRGAKRKQIETALESLEALGIVVSHGEGDGKMWTALRPAAHQRRLTPISV